MISATSPTAPYFPPSPSPNPESKSFPQADSKQQQPTGTPQRAPLDAESKVIRGWKEGIKENKVNQSMTYAMGIGCLVMNVIPGLRMKWGSAIKMAVANMGLMAVINQGFGMVKGYQGKGN